MSTTQTRLMTIFTQTPLHVGAGNSVGAVDAPVMRERHTRIPIIPGSSIKGVLADLWQEDVDPANQARKPGSELEALFGNVGDGKDRPALAGRLLIGEARVLAFPVRSAKHGFAWLTCPLALNRFKRDSGKDFPVPNDLAEMEAVAPDALQLKDSVVLEEYRCKVKDGVSPALIDAVKALCSNPVWSSMPERLCIVSDELFCYFAEQACEVVTRIRIDDETGTVAGGALFNQEQVPSETLLYSVIGSQTFINQDEDMAVLEKLTAKLKDAGGVLQLGGDETIGLGVCSVEVIA